MKNKRKGLIKRVLLCMALIALTIPTINAKKIFYDSKSWIVNVAGDPQALISNGLNTKINPVKVNVTNPLTSVPSKANESYFEYIAQQMTEERYGKKFIDAITQNGTSEEQLYKMTLKNVQKADEEFGGKTLRGGENEEALRIFLKENAEPILMYNYYCFTYGTEYYALFKVKVTKEQAFDILSSLGDSKRYNDPSMQFPIEFVRAGKLTDLEKNIDREAPDMALRGVLKKRNPAIISLGTNQGVERGNLIAIYSQRQDKNGNRYSKRISRARVGKVWADSAQVNFEAGTAGNRKNGDVVVRTRDKHTRFGFMATWQPHVWGGQIFSDTKMSFMRSGVINHTLVDLSFSMTEKPGDTFISTVYSGEKYRAPMFVNFGVGYGISKTFLGFMDFMPFFIVQYEGSFMSCCADHPDNYKDHAPFGSAIRVPVGLRFSINLKYPCRLALEAGWAYHKGFGEDQKVIQQACDYMNVKRGGIFFNLGFIF